MTYHLVQHVRIRLTHLGSLCVKLRHTLQTGVFKCTLYAVVPPLNVAPLSVNTVQL